MQFQEEILKRFHYMPKRENKPCPQNLMFFNPFPNKPWFLPVCIISLENNVGKGEIPRNMQFLLFALFSIGFENFLVFIKLELVICKFFLFGRV